jgi:hypothetical protein
MNKYVSEYAQWLDKQVIFGMSLITADNIMTSFFEF